MTTVNTDAKYNGLGKYGYKGAQEDRELQFYKANGATSNSLPDAELEFLSVQGFSSGTVEDRWVAYLLSLGYKGSKEDMINPWWGEFPGSSLYLDFTKPSPFTSTSGLDPRITFTRSTTATFTGSDGLIQTAAIDAPRFDYNPVTLAPLGLLIEEQRANLHLYSQNFSTGWTATATVSTLTAAAATAPDGTTTAGSFLCADTTNAARRVFASANITVSVSTAYTASIYVKPVNGWQWVSLAVTSGTALTAGIGSVVFDLTNGVVGTTIQTATGASLTAYSITAVGNGWFRLVVSGVQDTTSTILRPKIILLDADEPVASAAVGVVGAGVYIWGAQLEAGAFPTSYLPTEASQVTRAADLASMTGANFSSWFNASEGTLVAVGIASYISGTTYGNLARIDNGGLTNSVVLAYRTSQQATINSGGVTVLNQVAKTPLSGFSKFAIAYALDNSVSSTDGLLATVDTSCALPIGLNRMRIGSSNVTANLNGHIQRITYYPRRLADAQLQALTS
jgi:hypothetical protein